MNKVSVIIASFNAGKYIKECVESVLKQAYKEKEIIIVDGGSTDNTFQEIEGFGDDFRLIKLRMEEYALKGRDFSYESFHRNTGIKNASGDYFVFLDGDDLLGEEKLQLQVKMLQENPSFGMVYSDLYYCDEKGNNIELLSKKMKLYSGKIFSRLIKGNFIPVHAAMLPRTTVEKVGGFDENIGGSSDWEMWLRTSAYYEVGFIDKPLVKYRMHGSNISKKRYWRAMQTEVTIEKLLTMPGSYNNLRISMSQKAYLNYKAGCNYYFLNDKGKSVSSFLKAIINNPFYLKAYVFLLLRLINVPFENIRLLISKINGNRKNNKH